MTATDIRAEDPWTGRLTPSEVHTVLFSRAGLGRRGYDEGEVDLFLERVQHELARLIAEKTDLREQVDRLRSRTVSGEGDATPRRDEASAQAVRILSAAQQTADQYVAEAEAYSKRLTIEAREECDQLIEDARQRSQALLEAAGQAAAAASESLAPRDDTQDENHTDDVIQTTQAKKELEEQVAYLRTFSEVCRVQLRAYLEALLQDIEVEWGKAQPEVAANFPRTLANDASTLSSSLLDDNRMFDTTLLDLNERATGPEPHEDGREAAVETDDARRAEDSATSAC